MDNGDGQRGTAAAAEDPARISLDLACECPRGKGMSVTREKGKSEETFMDVRRNAAVSRAVIYTRGSPRLDTFLSEDLSKPGHYAAATGKIHEGTVFYGSVISQGGCGELLAWYRFPKIVLWETIPITRSHHVEVATHRDPTCALVAQPTGAIRIKDNLT
ncbi:hypothetical protein WN48_04535 [Eufriesea mexicana]|nr:hypothetical protein WN48_04535 [Eufriesea mexicana]